MTMNSKVSKKISTLTFAKDQVIDVNKCKNIKGGGYYFCCTRNKWIQY